MKREILFSMESPFRDTFRIQGFRFGGKRKSLAIVGAMRGDEILQQYVCSQLVKRLSRLESEGELNPEHGILIIPSANPYSMNIGKRFWAMDNTDINRMFPGYDKGETTQRIAASLFEAIQGYAYGIQLASFYVPGDFVPHVRIIQTGYEDVDTAGLFGLPYICLRKSSPFDTTLLNYNWQVWDTKAYSVYGGQNNGVEGEVAPYILNSLLRFMNRAGIIRHAFSAYPDFNSQIVHESDLSAVKAPVAGIFRKMKTAGNQVKKGEVMALITDPYEGETLCEIKAPTSGVVFFAHNQPLALQQATLFKIHEA